MMRTNKLMILLSPFIVNWVNFKQGGILVVEAHDDHTASDVQLTNVSPMDMSSPVEFEMCGCETSACPGNCATFEVGKCQVHYQCFLELNGIFGYILPSHTQDNNNTEITTLTISIYDNAQCIGTPRFQFPEQIGWQGSCGDSCWSTTSMIGVPSCYWKSNDDDTGTIPDDDDNSPSLRSRNTFIATSIIIIMTSFSWW